MNNKPILLLLLLLAAGVLFWFLGGSGLFAGDPGRGDDAYEGVGGGDLSTAGGGSLEGAAAESEGRRGPTLFGRRLEDLVGRGGLRGLVKNFKTGEAVAGATVVLLGSGYGDEKVSSQVLTGPTGHFELADIPAGDGYQLHLSAPSKLQRSYPSVSVDAGGERDLGALWLGESGLLEGVVTDPAGRPVAKADVQVFAGGGSMMEIARNFTKLFSEMHKDAEPLTRTKTDAQGRFRIQALDPGPISILVRARGYQQKMQDEVMTSAGAAGGVVQVRVQDSDPLVGMVVDENDRGVAGARVACLQKNDMSSILFGRQFSETNDEGTFRIESPPGGGDLAVIVTAEGFPMLLAEVKASTPDLRLVLHGGAELLLRLVEKDTRRPVVGASLMGMFNNARTFQSDNMNMASGVTDERGEVTLLVRAGTLQMLWVNHPERGSGMFSPMMGAMGAGGIISGPEDTTIQKPRTTLEFQLQTGITVRGRVADGEWQPVPGARVMAMGAMGLGGMAATTGGDGRYELRGQSSPITALVATAPGYVQEPKGFGGIVGEPGQDVEHDIVMQKAATLSGRVLGASGKPLAGVRVRAGAGGASAMIGMLTGTTSESITNKEGRYILTGVAPADDARVLGRLAGWLDSQTPPFSVFAGAANEAPDLKMRAGAALDIVVLDPDGSPARGARVQVSVEAEDSVSFDPMSAFRGFDDQVTREDGSVRIKDLPDGTITVTVSKDGFAASRRALTVKEGSAAAEGAPGGKATLSLREAYVLRGRVRDPEGKPLEGVEVDCNPVQFGQARAAALADETPWVPHGTALSGKDGRFEIPDMPDLPMHLELSGEGFQETKQTLAGPRGEAEITVRRMEAGSAARLEAIQAEITKAGMQYGGAKTDEEKQAALKKIQRLSLEKAALEAGKSPSEAQAAAAGLESDAPLEQDR
jgi:protocatechuate 3,4-dioxygenase beta subunit